MLWGGSSDVCCGEGLSVVGRECCGEGGSV